MDSSFSLSVELQKALYVEDVNSSGTNNGDMYFMPVKTPEEAASFVRKWMEDRNFFKNDLRKDGALFSYEGISGAGLAFAVQQPKDYLRVVGVTTRLIIDSKQQKALADLDAKERDVFIKGLRSGLLFKGPAYVLGPKEGSPEWVLFIKEISYDELTEGRLMDAVDQINRAVIFASIIITDNLGESEGE